MMTMNFGSDYTLEENNALGEIYKSAYKQVLTKTKSRVAAEHEAHKAVLDWIRLNNA